MRKVNLFEELLSERNKEISSDELKSIVKKIWSNHDSKKDQIRISLNKKNDDKNNQLKFDKMESKNIFHKNTIKKICVRYRLRFLDSNLFKGEYPKNITRIITDLESKHDTSLSNFKIMAPSKLFKIKSPDDPILFVPIGNDYFYLVHKWGKEFNKLRKLMVLPFKNIDNLTIFSILVSVFFALVGKLVMPSLTSSEVFILFLFLVKGFIFIFFYMFFLTRRNFSESNWNSKYDSF
jgi:ribosomal protein S20